MMHPLLQLAATRPQLLIDHLGAWADVLATESGPATAALRKGLLLQGLAVACAAAGLLLAGVAVMLWAVMPVEQALSTRAATALLLIPLLALLAAAACAIAAGRMGDGGAWARLGRQWRADMALLMSAERP